MDVDRYNSTQATLDSLAGKTATNPLPAASVTISLSASTTTVSHSVTMSGKVTPGLAMGVMGVVGVTTP